MPIPTTREELFALGWQFRGEGKCRDCGAQIEWWNTPKNRMTPMRVIPEKQDFGTGEVIYRRISHFADCPAAKKFRRK